MEFSLTVLDLTSTEVLKRLDLKSTDLISDDLEVPQTLAELAAEAGFDGVVGPSAASPSATTLAVFEPITGHALAIVDSGVRTTPS